MSNKNNVLTLVKERTLRFEDLNEIPIFGTTANDVSKVMGFQ